MLNPEMSRYLANLNSENLNCSSIEMLNYYNKNSNNIPSNFSIIPNFSYLIPSMNNSTILATQYHDENFVNQNNYNTQQIFQNNSKKLYIQNFNNYCNTKNGSNSMMSINDIPNGIHTKQNYNTGIDGIQNFIPNHKYNKQININNQINYPDQIKNQNSSNQNQRFRYNYNNRKTLNAYQQKKTIPNNNYSVSNRPNNQNFQNNLNPRQKLFNSIKKCNSLKNCFSPKTENNHEILVIKFKLENSEKILKVNKYDDYLEASKIFCKINNLPENLALPISTKINLAISSINEAFNTNLLDLDIEYINSLNKLWQNLKDRKQAKNETEKDESSCNIDKLFKTNDSLVKETFSCLESFESLDNESLSTYNSEELSFNNISTITVCLDDEESPYRANFNNSF